MYVCVHVYTHEAIILENLVTEVTMNVTQEKICGGGPCPLWPPGMFLCLCSIQ